VLKMIHKLREFVEQRKRPNFRDRRGHYPSGILSCLRDQVWAWQKEDETNPPDFHASLKMLIGDAIEKGLMHDWFSYLHLVGYHYLGGQIAVGGSNPSWDGYLDGLVAAKDKDGNWTKRVLEVKCLFGYGANAFMKTYEPKDSHLIQLGLYLKDLHEKNILSEGILVYVPLSDSNAGNLVFVHCRYLKESNEIEAYLAQPVAGDQQSISYRQSITTAIERMKEIDKHVENKTIPKGEFAYKAPITQGLLSTISDNDLREAVRGNKVIGDWQVKYSRYKDKQIAEDGLVLGYSDEEIAILKKEYLSRHPKSKI